MLSWSFLMTSLKWTARSKHWVPTWDQMLSYHFKWNFEKYNSKLLGMEPPCGVSLVKASGARSQGQGSKWQNLISQVSTLLLVSSFVGGSHEKSVELPECSCLAHKIIQTRITGQSAINKAYPSIPEVELWHGISDVKTHSAINHPILVVL